MKATRLTLGFAMIIGMLLTLFVALPASAANDCVFVDTGSALVLQGDCTTDGTLYVPDGYTLDGNGYAVTAVDPTGGHFVGAVVQNAGDEANVVNLTVTTSALANVCDAGDARLRGIMFDGASGVIAHNVVDGINQGPSGCQEGNAIEVRNEPFDGTHPNTVTVEVAHNTVTNYQKTGVLVNGDVSVSMHHNVVGASATQQNLAANSVQIGFGAMGDVSHNQIDGNQWLGASNFVATAILIYDTGELTVAQNNVRGNSDVGIYLYADGVTVGNNRVFDEGADGAHGDYGIGNWGNDNVVTNNKVRGFDTPYDGDVAGDNKVVGSPN